MGFRRHSSIILNCIVTPWVRVVTPEHYVVFEVVVYRRAYIDEEFARWAAAPERYFSSLTGTTPRTGFEGHQKASSLKLLQEKVRPRPWSTNFPQRVRRTLGVATPHKGEHTKARNGF